MHLVMFGALYTLWSDGKDIKLYQCTKHNKCTIDSYPIPLSCTPPPRKLHHATPTPPPLASCQSCRTPTTSTTTPLPSASRHRVTFMATFVPHLARMNLAIVTTHHLAGNLRRCPRRYQIKEYKRQSNQQLSTLTSSSSSTSLVAMGSSSEPGGLSSLELARRTTASSYSLCPSSLIC